MSCELTGRCLGSLSWAEVPRSGPARCQGFASASKSHREIHPSQNRSEQYCVSCRNVIFATVYQMPLKHFETQNNSLSLSIAYYFTVEKKEEEIKHI